MTSVLVCKDTGDTHNHGSHTCGFSTPPIHPLQKGFWSQQRLSKLMRPFRASLTSECLIRHKLIWVLYENEHHVFWTLKLSLSLKPSACAELRSPSRGGRKACSTTRRSIPQYLQFQLSMGGEGVILRTEDKEACLLMGHTRQEGEAGLDTVVGFRWKSGQRTCIFTLQIAHKTKKIVICECSLITLIPEFIFTALQLKLEDIGSIDTSIWDSGLYNHCMSKSTNLTGQKSHEDIDKIDKICQLLCKLQLR